MPFCRNCGVPVREEDRFCYSCGHAQHIEHEEATPSSPSEHTEEEINESASTPQEEADVKAPEKSTKSMRRYNGLFVVSLLHLIFLFLPTGLLALYYTFRAEKAEDCTRSLEARRTAWLINTLSAAFIFGILFFFVAMRITLTVFNG